MNRTCWIIYLLLTGALKSWSQEIMDQGTRNDMFDTPRIINYSKSEYGADIQNWRITQSADGTMYFANNEGLLSYNGSRWELHPHPDGLIVRSVAAGPDRRIYAGAYEDFGYWDRDPFGNFSYHSLKNLVSDFNFHNQEIWKILTTGDSVWFQSFTVVFLYANDQVKVFNAPGLITSFSNIRGEHYARITGRGLYRVGADGFELVDDDPFFREKMIRVILPFGRSEWLVATSEDGIFIYSGEGRLRPWNLRYRNQMVDRVINRGLLSSEGQYIFGTQLSGIQIFDTTGAFIFGLNQESGLQNNTILSLYDGEDGFLWAGLDNGIDQIDLQSGISFYHDRPGHIGAVYDVLLKGDLIYAGTNKGLFYSSVSETSAGAGIALDFKLIPDTESQVWSLDKFGDQIFCGHNTGTFEVEGGNAKRVSDVSGGYALRPMRQGPDQYLIQGTYSDLVVFSGRNGKWEYDHRVSGFNQPAKYIEADHLGNIWAGHNTKGLYKVMLNPEMTAISEMTYYGSENGFSSDFQIGVFRLQNRVVFLNEGNLYTYDDLNDTIVPFKILNDQIRETDRFHKIIHALDDDYWFISDSHLVLFGISRDQMQELVRYPFNLFDNSQIRSYEAIRTFQHDWSILCLDDGLALIPHAETSLRKIEGTPLFTAIRSTNGREWEQLPLISSHASQPPELKYQFNSMEFHFAAPYYGSSIRYRILLEGLGEGWRILREPVFRVERLPAGEYALRIAAVDGMGNQTEEIRWPFLISEPWYWSVTSRILYVLAFLLLLLMIIRYFMKRLTMQEKRLLARQEAEIIRIRNEQLRSEVSFKSKELANTTFNIMKKNELLLEMKSELEKELRTSSPDHRRSLRRIIRLVDRNISHEEDWKVFESNFERAHEEFLFRMKEQFPNLTPGNLKLCAYLRMNLSTKKIALLLGISTRGVENHRYRLRSKLNLPRDRNLVEFMMEH